MQTLTAIIRSKPGHAETIRRALEAVGHFAQENEPDTLGFYVAQDTSNSCVFTTYERFKDSAAMDRHNNGAGSKGFFAATEGLLDGDVIVVTATEFFAR